MAATAERWILHADLDAFFASVEQLDDPGLRGRPVLVGGDGPRGVVAAASYEARVFGCRSAQPMAVARRNCPHAAVVPPRFARYRELSSAVFEVYESFTPLIEPLSIDEAFLDLSGSLRLLGEPAKIGAQIKARVLGATGLRVSVGVGPNKFVAKLASDLGKPDGLVVVGPERVRAVLDPLAVGRLWGVGGAAERRLAGLGIRTIGDVASYDPAALAAALGDHASQLWALAHGHDDRPVTPDREAKSISHERTFPEDVDDPGAVRAVLLGQGEDVARRLRRHGRLARIVTVKLRYGDFETRTRSRTLDAPTDLTGDIRSAAGALYDDWAGRGFRPIRLIGVGVSGLSEPGEGVGRGVQGELFKGPVERERQRRLDAATDAIAARHGRSAIRRGGPG